jgi:hypothetical protein
MRIMYDAVNLDNLPNDADLYAGYTSGHWPTFGALAERFPCKVYVSIAVNASHNAMVLDVESGDATPSQVPEWVLRQRVLGGIPTVYCSTSVWPSVIAACRAAHVALPQWWEAHYDGISQLSPGSIAKQFKTGAYDVSVVADDWPGVDPPQGDDMTVQELFAAMASADAAIRAGKPLTPEQQTIVAGADLIAHRLQAIEAATK